MNLFVTDTSKYILSFLDMHRQGQVHSIYRKTINLSFEGQLVALQAAGSPLSPISVILPLTDEEMASLSIAPGMSVTADSDSLFLGQKHQILFSRAFFQDLKLVNVLTSAQLCLLEERLFALLSHHEAGSFELFYSQPERASQIPFLAVAEGHLRAASKDLAASCWEEAAKRLCRLIGLGLGLTPGGDDFLCGLLAALILSGSSRHPFSRALCTQIATHLTDTNEISAAFLRCALEEQFSQAVNSLSLLPTKEEIYASFTAIGHSSGTDTLCGIMYLLKNRAYL